MMDMRWSAQCRRKLDLHTYVRAPRRKATAVFFSRIVIYILMVEQLGDMLGADSQLDLTLFRDNYSTLKVVRWRRMILNLQMTCR